MQQTKVHIITQSKDLPTMSSKFFLHSPEMFRLIEKLSGSKPYMAVVEDENGHVVGHLLVTTYWHSTLFPPFFFKQARAIGAGEYANGINTEEVFGLFVCELSKVLKRKLCLSIKFTNLPTKMFAYKHFKANKFFAISHIEVYNKLQDCVPQKKLNSKMQLRIQECRQHGLETHQATTEQELNAFYKIYHHAQRYNLFGYTPDKQLYTSLLRDEKISIFVTCKDHQVVGGCLCLYSKDSVYTTCPSSSYKASSEICPSSLTLWTAINDAYQKGYQSFYFVDTILSKSGNPQTDFILNFGGIPINKHQWYHLNLPLINTLICKWIVG